MKLKYLLIGCILTLISSESCSYLDIVPDEMTTEEDTYQNENLAKQYLYACYGAMPRRNSTDYMIEWRAMDTEYLLFESTFTNTNYSPSDVKQNQYTWSQLWEGIRLCYKFLDIVDKTPNISAENLRYFKGEATFLIAYYHFVSLQCYGPTCIIKSFYDPNTPTGQLPERSSYDEVVQFIDEKLEEALPNLAESMTGVDYGRATKAAVWAVRSRMYLYRASKLFNGNMMYAAFKSKLDNRNLISQEYDSKKWEKSVEVSKKAIEFTESLGYHLYGDVEAGIPDKNNSLKPGLSNPAQRRVRYCFMDDQNTMEILLAETRSEGQYDLQQRSLPRWKEKQPYVPSNSIAPPLKMVEKFYTENGLPMEFDKSFDYESRYTVVDMPVNYDGNNYSDKSNGKTFKMHLNREPRFYAWIGFHNGFAETAKHNSQTTSTENAKKAIVLKMRKNDEQGKGNRTSHYSITGYLSKKFVHPANDGKYVRYPFPVFRMAELYLNYAEALVEVGGEANLSLAKWYIDKVRVRAGVPTVDDAWDNYSTKPGHQNTQEGMREIVRREREIEFYLEGQHFWDTRRWMTTEEELSHPHKVLNINGATDEDFFQVMDCTYPVSFSKAQYLMPIATTEINKMSQMVQNPFY